DSRGSDTGRLVEFDIESRRSVVLAEDREFDIGGVMIHPDRYTVQAVTITRDRTEWTVLDESIRPDLEALSGLHDGDFSIISRDHADRLWLVRYEDDDHPVAYYLFDRSEQKGTFLFFHQPELQNYRLAETEPFRMKSRDGLVLRGYLTFPPGRERKNLPMVVNVHGGPWSRDVWGYDSRAQWLANRGYLCLELNFRGSVGFGKKFVNAGDREWGRNMQNDLVDAVEWAVKQGHADPSRIGIFGASYGGYAALAGAAFTPELFRCAVDVVGPSNLITFIRTVPPYWTTELATIYRRVGDPEKDADFLRERSPLFRADHIRIPILIAQGANDPRVKREESDEIVAALERNGVEHEYLLFPDEGHGFVKPENRLKFYAAAEAFLARHLGGRSEAETE
ncbi:MAG: S9 family peptidase, partial [Candidatus Omnitrophica bacterium]|nr:S9 family peptidase [Candidatus Omnitrophota bacterium]